MYLRHLRLEETGRKDSMNGGDMASPSVASYASERKAMKGRNDGELYFKRGITEGVIYKDRRGSSVLVLEVGCSSA